MAKKADLLQKARELKLDVSAKNTIAEIETAISEIAAKPEAQTPRESIAKAGKRSAKSQAEAEKQQTKVEHQHHREEETEATTATAKPKKQQKPARSRLERRGKKFRAAASQIEKGKVYPIKDAVELALKTSPVQFDATVEMHIRLNVDPKQSDQNVRDTVVLPAGTGKKIRIAVFADGKSSADISGVETITKMLDKETLDFDVLISTPANMPNLGKYARLLGPRGLMPNPKSGTVATDITKAVDEARAGRVEYRVDAAGIIHVALGKVSFGTTKVLENVEALNSSVKANKPSNIKGSFVRSVFISTTMGPSIPAVLE